MAYKIITSQNNPLIKEALRIKKRQRRDRENVFIIEGPHPIEAALSSRLEIEEVFFTETFACKEEGKRLLKKMSTGTYRLLQVPEQIISRLSDTEAPQGIIAVISYTAINLNEITFSSVPLLVLCDGIQEPGNLGSIIRVSDAAGADCVVMLPGACDAFSQKAIRASAGSLFNIPIIYAEYTELFDSLAFRHIDLYATDTRGPISIYSVDLREPVALAFGNEAQGVSKALRDKVKSLISIPIIGGAESLNVASAASVCLYEAVRQRMFTA
ncbi:MAG: TrmH family RNA methyltransferase [Dissulfurispiraceae bacterium]